jgi:hypothetical protein
VPVRTLTRTGPRSPTLLNAGGYRIGLLNATIVSPRPQADIALRCLTVAPGKKLKKRLEDLERRAGSSSASPEQKHEELAQPEPVSSNHSAHASISRPRSTSNQAHRARTPDVVNQHYVLPSSEMFSQQYTRQMSTSPPPFTYAGLPSTTAMSYGSYSQPATYCSLPTTTADMHMYPQYVPAMDQNYISPPIKSEQGFYFDDDTSPFAASYAAISGVDVSAPESYPYVSTKPHHPPFSRSYSAPTWAANSG